MDRKIKIKLFPQLRKKLEKLHKPKSSLLHSWIMNNMVIFVLILSVIASVLIYLVQTYSYYATQQYLTEKLKTTTSVLQKYSTDPTKNFSSEVRNMVETFSDKDKIELMAINSKGKVVLTSSGFSPDDSIQMNDYDKAMKAKYYGYWTGLSENNEKIMAVSYPVSAKNSDYSAMRVVVSMSEIDHNIFIISMIIIGVCLLALMPLLFSGFYFVGSIVRPVQKVNDVTKKFASGNFSERITDDAKDELGQLCQSINNMADELSTSEAMKNEFISSVSHELRTPLTAIKGWAETLETEDDLVTVRKGIHVISSETERLQQMVEELLDFSRMQNGKFTLQFAMLDILAELDEAILIYNEKAKRENAEIIEDSPEMLPFVYGDKSRLKQVFINIIDNAIKYSSGPDRKAVINIKAAVKDKDHIIISVEDNGCGISAADLPKIKTKFYKANHTKRGSGIGLAVADEIVTMHHGSLNITSKENKGTRVEIILPTMPADKTN